MLPSILSSLLFHPLFQHTFFIHLNILSCPTKFKEIKKYVVLALYKLLRKPSTKKLSNNLLFGTLLQNTFRFYYLQNLKPDFVFRTSLFKQILICIKRGPKILSFGSFLHILTILTIHLSITTAIIVEAPHEKPIIIG